MYNLQGITEFRDDWDYISYGKQINEQGIWLEDTGKLKDARIGPGFPLIIAALFRIFGENYYAIFILNALISSLIPLVIYFLGKQVFSRKTALLSALWGVIYILHIHYVNAVLKEIWLAFLLPLLIYLFILEVKKDKINWLSLLLSVLYAFLIHMDERYFTYFPVFAISFFVLDNDYWGKRLKKAALFVIIVLILMIPWLVRNYQIYGRIVILTERTTRFTDKIFGYKEEVEERKREKAELTSYLKAKRDSILLGKEVDEEIKGNWIRKMKKAIAKRDVPHEFNTAERWWAELKEFWRPIRLRGSYVGNGLRYEPPYTLKHNLGEGLTYGILLPFFLIGCYFVIKRKNKYGIFFIVIIFAQTFIHVVLAHVRNRYRIPVDSLIILISFYGITKLINKIKKDKVKIKS